MKNLLLASLVVLAFAFACTPKEGATTPENDPAANNATNNDTPPEPEGKIEPAEGEEK